tara:strand:+ start:346 stop:942 length:597 start_codon:yes stop_codon:yes gene_type:complete
MGLGNNEGGNSKFVTIVGGKWTLRVPEGTEGAVPRELTKGANKGKEVHELYFDHLDGSLVGAELKTGQFGTDLCLDIEDEGVVYNAQMAAESDFFASFAKCCENIDPNKQLFLGLGQPKGEGFPYLYVQSDGKQLTSNYTKDNPNGCPPWEKKEKMGKVVWDRDAQNNFLYDIVVKFIEGLGDAEEAPLPPTDDTPPF